MEDMEDMYKSLRNEYMSLLTERRDALHRCNEKDEIINELRAKVDRLHAENEELKLFVPSDEELTDKKKKFETMIDQFEVLNRDNKYFHELIDRLQIENASLRVRVKELEVWKKIAEDVQRELELSTKRVKELEEELVDYEAVIDGLLEDKYLG